MIEGQPDQRVAALAIAAWSVVFQKANGGGLEGECRRFVQHTTYYGLCACRDADTVLGRHREPLARARIEDQGLGAQPAPLAGDLGSECNRNARGGVFLTRDRDHGL